jgi:hypothetical protein
MAVIFAFILNFYFFDGKKFIKVTNFSDTGVWPNLVGLFGQLDFDQFTNRFCIYMKIKVINFRRILMSETATHPIGAAP